MTWPSVSCYNDTGDLGSIYLNKRPKGSSEKHSSSQHKALSYAQKLVSALSFTMCSVPFALYDEASLNPRGRSLYFQSNIPISSAKQIVAQCSHSSLNAPVIQLSETTDSVPLHTIPGITISVGSKRCPDTWYRLYENHPVRLHIPVQDMSVKAPLCKRASGEYPAGLSLLLSSLWDIVG